MSGLDSDLSLRTGRETTNIGNEAVVNALPDGYTLIFFDASPSANATLYDKLSFNFIRDIAPIVGVMRVPLIMIVNPSSPAKTFQEFVAYAQANPGKVNYASPGNGTPNHLCGELF